MEFSKLHYDLRAINIIWTNFYRFIVHVLNLLKNVINLYNLSIFCLERKKIFVIQIIKI